MTVLAMLARGIPTPHIANSTGVPLGVVEALNTLNLTPLRPPFN